MTELDWHTSEAHSEHHDSEKELNLKLRALIAAVRYNGWRDHWDGSNWKEKSCDVPKHCGACRLQAALAALPKNCLTCADERYIDCGDGENRKDMPCPMGCSRSWQIES